MRRTNFCCATDLFWNSATKSGLFQCLHIVTETTLQNSRWLYSNVPISLLKRNYKIVADDILMSAFFPWSNITKQSLMIFQCLHFVTETTLQNSSWWYSNVPIFSLKRYYKTVTHKFQMSPFCRWSNIQNCRWWYSNVPILSLKRHYKTVTDDTQQVGKESHNNFFGPCYKLQTIYQIENWT